MHPQLKISGETITLSHLQPVVREIVLKLRGGLKKKVTAEIHFSCHCYSRGLKDGEMAEPGHEVSDGSSHKPRPRVFDRERYELSKGLPACIDNLIAANAVVSRTRQENFYRVEKVEPQRDGSAKTISYFIFMHARKVQAPNRPKSIRLQIESAYPEQDGVPHPRGVGSRTFSAMLGEKWVA